jgi:hypothetical protein
MRLTIVSPRGWHRLGCLFSLLLRTALIWIIDLLDNILQMELTGSGHGWKKRERDTGTS